MKLYNIIILFLLILNFVDYDTTVRIIKAGGSEANPIMNYVISVTGALWPMLVIKTGFMAMIWCGFYLTEVVAEYLLFLIGFATLIYTGVVVRSVKFCIDQGLF